MAKFFHRLPNGDFKIFDSESEYLEELKRYEGGWPVKTMICIGLLFIVVAILTWENDDLASDFLLIGFGVWVIGFTILGVVKARKSDLVGSIIFNIALIPVWIMLAYFTGAHKIIMEYLTAIWNFLREFWYVMRSQHSH